MALDIAVLVFPGTNRDKDMADAFHRLTGTRPRLVWHKDTDIGKPDLIALPGGFAHGDYLRTGAMAKVAPVIKPVIAAANRGTPVFGVCNGFQLLCEVGLLPGVLMRNQHLKFHCKQIRMRLENDAPLFTSTMKVGHVMQVPIAHGEGNYRIDDDGLVALHDNGQVAFRYCDSEGATTESANAPGALESIAGVYSKDKRILGMMPHPEDATDPVVGGTEGLPLFQSMVAMLGVA